MHRARTYSGGNRHAKRGQYDQQRHQSAGKLARLFVHRSFCLERHVKRPVDYNSDKRKKRHATGVAVEDAGVGASPEVRPSIGRRYTDSNPSWRLLILSISLARAIPDGRDACFQCRALGSDSSQVGILTTGVNMATPSRFGHQVQTKEICAIHSRKTQMRFLKQFGTPDALTAVTYRMTRLVMRIR